MSTRIKRDSRGYAILPIQRTRPRRGGKRNARFKMAINSLYGNIKPFKARGTITTNEFPEQ